MICKNCSYSFEYEYNNFKGSYTEGKHGRKYFMYIPCPFCGKKVLTFTCSSDKYYELMKNNFINHNHCDYKDFLIEDGEELKKYKKIGTVEQCQKYKSFYKNFNKEL